MIIAGAVLSCYLAIAALMWAWVAYTMGKHYGKEHDGKRSPNCSAYSCANPVSIVVVSSLLWPLLIVVGTGQWWNSLWSTAGANATLPPENSHPTAKAPDVEFLP